MEIEKNSIRASYEAFEHDFVRFWELSARVQMYSQTAIALSARIEELDGNERIELETFRNELKENGISEMHEIFDLMSKLSMSGDELSADCYSMLSTASKSVCVCFAKLAACNDEIKSIFLGKQ